MEALNSKRWSKGGPDGYVFAIFGVFIAFCIRYSLHGFLQNSIPMTFFIINTIVISFLFGYRPSILTIILAVPLAFFFFVPPFNSFEAPTPQDAFVFISYILIAFIAVGNCGMAST